MINIDDINARLKKSLQGKTPKLKCIISGIERATSIDYLKTKEEKFGSIENFTRYFISRDAIRMIKEGKSIQEIKDELNPQNSFIPDINLINEAKKYYDL